MQKVADGCSVVMQGACPALETLTMSGCPSLQYVLVQSSSLTQIDLSNCGSLNKVSSGWTNGVSLVQHRHGSCSYANWLPAVAVMASNGGQDQHMVLLGALPP